MIWRSTSTLTLAGLTLVGCIGTVTPPEPTAQASVPYGPKVYLRDSTIQGRGNVCKQLGEVQTTSTATTVDGQPVTDPTKAFNCFVEVAPGELKTDIIETTNDLFQLCVDSTVCKKPDPNDVEKGPACNSESDFGTCPVVSVQYTEAKRFCEFIGRRLPSTFEHIIMRQQNRPQRPGDVLHFPTKDTAPTGSCDDAVLQSCGSTKPFPMAVSADGTSQGAGKLDRTEQGVFDLTGNVTEWAVDLLPSRSQPAETELPWFCLQAVVTSTMTACPECPKGRVCVKGDYNLPNPALSPPISCHGRPVCVTASDLAFTNGSVGSLVGGNYALSTSDEGSSGLFVRREEPTPDKDPADRSNGFRCVGEAGVEGGIVGVVDHP